MGETCASFIKKGWWHFGLNLAPRTEPSTATKTSIAIGVVGEGGTYDPIKSIYQVRCRVKDNCMQIEAFNWERRKRAHAGGLSHTQSLSCQQSITELKRKLQVWTFTSAHSFQHTLQWPMNPTGAIPWPSCSSVLLRDKATTGAREHTLHLRKRWCKDVFKCKAPQVWTPSQSLSVTESSLKHALNFTRL